ncbi:hypothetical protein CEXT_317501, partial [Caerostris extrusa]
MAAVSGTKSSESSD